MFKFNFSNIENNDVPNLDEPTDKNDDLHEYALIDEEPSASLVETGLFNFDDFNIERKNSFIKSQINFNKFYLTESFANENLASIDYVDVYKLEIDENDSLAKINKTHDLVAGQYEGGLKVWELSMDLSRFIYNLHWFDLEDKKSKFSDTDTFEELKSVKEFFSNFINFVSNYINNPSSETNAALELKVLELGCGHALPALTVTRLLENAIENKIESISDKSQFNDENCDFTLNVNIIVYLQDFNKQILESITFENVKKYLERSNNEKAKKSKFFYKNSSYCININKDFKFVYGDWRLMLDEENLILPKNYFNLILTSETIYNSLNYKHLLNIFKECLLQKKNKMIDKTDKIVISDDEGIILLSAKTYYFGCGGNIYEFLNLVKSKNYQFNSSKNLLFDLIISNSSYSLLTNQISNLNDTCNRSKLTDFSENSTSSHSSTHLNEDDVTDFYTSNISKEIVKIYFKY